jgi:hypothetical protein
MGCPSRYECLRLTLESVIVTIIIILIDNAEDTYDATTDEKYRQYPEDDTGRR